MVVQIRDATSGELLHELKSHVAPIVCLRAARQQNWLATADTSGEIRIWQTELALERPLLEFESPMRGLAQTGTSPHTIVLREQSPGPGGKWSNGGPNKTKTESYATGQTMPATVVQASSRDDIRQARPREYWSDGVLASLGSSVFLTYSNETELEIADASHGLKKLLKITKAKEDVNGQVHLEKKQDRGYWTANLRSMAFMNDGKSGFVDNDGVWQVGLDDGIAHFWAPVEVGPPPKLSSATLEHSFLQLEPGRSDGAGIQPGLQTGRLGLCRRRNYDLRNFELESNHDSFKT